MGTSRLRVAAALTTCAALVVLTACGGGGEPTSTDQPNKPATQAEAVAKYGLLAVKDPKTTYQPDVVFIDKGPESIRSVTPSGLVWTLDGKAKGVSDLEIGKVMFASRVALGRVLDVRKQGEDVQVVIAPVLIQDVIKDGLIKVDTPMDMSAMTFQTYPDAPAAFIDQSASGATPEPTSPRSRKLPDGIETITMPTLRPAAAVQAGLGARKPSNPQGAKVTIGNYEAELKWEQNGVMSLKLLRQGSIGDTKIRGGITAKLKFNNPRVKVNMPIADGRPSATSSYALSGLEEISGSWEFGGKEDSKVRIEIPVDAPFGPAMWGPVPISAVLKYKAIITFGLTSKNTTLNGNVTYQISGPIGTGTAPKATTNGSILDKTSSTTLGPWGVLFAFEFKLIVGAGAPQFMGGIYGKVILSIGLTGSGPMSIVECSSAYTKINFSAGLGSQISFDALKEFKDFFDKILTKKGKDLWEKMKGKFETEQTVLNSGDMLIQEAYKPRINACKPS